MKLLNLIRRFWPKPAPRPEISLSIGSVRWEHNNMNRLIDRIVDEVSNPLDFDVVVVGRTMHRNLNHLIPTLQRRLPKCKRSTQLTLTTQHGNKITFTTPDRPIFDKHGSTYLDLE